MPSAKLNLNLLNFLYWKCWVARWPLYLTQVSEAPSLPADAFNDLQKIADRKEADSRAPKEEQTKLRRRLVSGSSNMFVYAVNMWTLFHFILSPSIYPMDCCPDCVKAQKIPGVHDPEIWQAKIVVQGDHRELFAEHSNDGVQSSKGSSNILHVCHFIEFIHGCHFHHNIPLGDPVWCSKFRQHKNLKIQLGKLDEQYDILNNLLAEGEVTGFKGEPLASNFCKLASWLLIWHVLKSFSTFWWYFDWTIVFWTHSGLCKRPLLLWTLLPTPAWSEFYR